MRILVIGDTHVPFAHQDTIPFLAAVKKKFKPERIVHIGDVADFHALSRFVHDPDGQSASDEARLAALQLEPLIGLFPEALVCRGNHDRRLEDRASEAGVPASMMRSVSEILGIPADWEWADQWELDGVIFEHGDPLSGPSAHTRMAQANMQNTAIGHTHAHAGIAFIGNRKHLVWGFNVGCLINHKAYAFNYARKAAAKPIVGCGLIDNQVPIFVPMVLGSGGRWKGNL